MGDLYATNRREVNPRLGLLSLEGIGLLVALGYLGVADPHNSAMTMPQCPIKLATGLDCPACGGLRVIHDLLRRDLRKALEDNLLLVLVSPILLYLLYQHARTLRTGRQYEMPSSVASGLLITACAWGVVRNLPRWPWKPLNSRQRQ
jgi:hypothetical protein